ncbi:MAG: hypothetical protein AB1508_18925 [Pseudomonadota bacterium]
MTSSSNKGKYPQIYAGFANRAMLIAIMRIDGIDRIQDALERLLRAEFARRDLNPDDFINEAEAEQLRI